MMLSKLIKSMTNYLIFLDVNRPVNLCAAMSGCILAIAPHVIWYFYSSSSVQCYLCVFSVIEINCYCNYYVILFCWCFYYSLDQSKILVYMRKYFTNPWEYALTTLHRVRWTEYNSHTDIMHRNTPALEWTHGNPVHCCWDPTQLPYCPQNMCIVHGNLPKKVQICSAPFQP